MAALNLHQPPHAQTRLRYGVVYRPKFSLSMSGDAYLVREAEHTALISVIDGLGSGSEAFRAASLARERIMALAEASLTDIFQACHQALHDTRGAVMAVLRIDFQAGAVTFAGVGNIGIHVQSSAHDIKPISRNGIVGHRLPRIQEFRYPYTAGDLFILYSDGISSRFNLGSMPPIRPADDLQAVAEYVATQFGKDEDDVTLILARE